MHCVIPYKHLKRIFLVAKYSRVACPRSLNAHLRTRVARWTNRTYSSVCSEVLYTQAPFTHALVCTHNFMSSERHLVSGGGRTWNTKPEDHLVDNRVSDLDEK